MWRKLAMALAAVVSLGMATAPTDVMARGGGGHGGGGHGGGGGGGRSFGAPSNIGRGAPGGVMNRGVPRQTFVAPGNVSANNSANRRIIGNGRYAWIGNHRVHGRHRHGFIPGIGLAYYWYYDDCIVWVDGYGWVNLCGYDYGDD
jgi:hypothetical protein